MIAKIKTAIRSFNERTFTRANALKAFQAFHILASIAALAGIYAIVFSYGALLSSLAEALGGFWTSDGLRLLFLQFLAAAGIGHYFSYLYNLIEKHITQPTMKRLGADFDGELTNAPGLT